MAVSTALPLMYCMMEKPALQDLSEALPGDRVLMLERCTLVRLSVYVLTYCCDHVLVGLVDACLIQLL